MAKVVFKESSGTEPTLFPQNILDKISPNHPVRLVDEVVHKIAQYKGGGTSSSHLRMMLKWL